VHEQVLDLGEGRLGALARHGPPLHDRRGVSSQHERRLPAGSHGDHERAAAFGDQAPAGLHGGEQAAEVGDSVDTLLGLRRVRGAPLESHLDEGVAPQGLRQREPRGLTDDGDVGLDAETRECIEHGQGAQAGVLLVGHQGEHDPTGQPAAGEFLGGDDHRGHPALHVAGTPPLETVAVDPRPERIVHALDPDGVEVAGQDDGGPGCAGRADRHEARSAHVPGSLNHVGVEAAA
jgi:hypothetical protein